MYATKSGEAAFDGNEDQVVVLHDVTWRDYLRLLAMRGDRAGVRMYFLDGEIELMSPGSLHEWRKTLLARLLETWAIEVGVPLEGYGAWTLKKERKRAGAEPDECYVLGVVGDRRVPDLAIEVEQSRAGLAKHLIYARLGVRELWTLQRDGALVIRVLVGDTYVIRKKSAFLRSLDVAWLHSFVAHETQTQAVQALRADLRSRRRRS